MERSNIKINANKEAIDYMLTDESAKYMNFFCQRLKELMEKRNVNQVELSLAIGLSRSTVNKWISQKAIPRMATIEKLALYFDVPRAYFLEESNNNTRAYYLDPETAKIAQQIHGNPNLVFLFDAAKNSSPEDLKMVAVILNKIKSNK